jgi:hypothetical protein
VINKINKDLDDLSTLDNLFIITNRIAREHLISGYPIISAAVYLSIKDTHNAMKILIRSNELEYAYIFYNLINDDTYEGNFVNDVREG